MKQFALLLAAILFLTSVQPLEDKKKSHEFGIVIHGGAGTILKKNMTPEKDKAYRVKLNQVLETGYEMLDEGADAVSVVEACIWIMEDSPLFNAGKGAVFTNAGTNELDASIMRGQDLQAGAVAGIKTVKHPISAARLVMEKSPHVMLSGKGAETYAKEQGLEIVDPAYFKVERRAKQLERAKKKDEKLRGLDESKSKVGDQGFVPSEENDYKFGTVGVAVLDREGNLAAGTSTGGMTNKRWGRIGDSPVIGAGTYANNNTCAISCTGHGEFFIRYAVAHDISALMEYKKKGIQDAADEVVMKKLVEAGGSGGVIGIDGKGNVAMSFNSKGMYRGYFRQNDVSPWIGIYGDEKPD